MTTENAKYENCSKCRLHRSQWGSPGCDPGNCEHEAPEPPQARGKVRFARRLLREAFHSGELDDYEEACLRAAISSLDGALHEVHPPIGTTGISEESKQALDEHLKDWGKPKS